MIMADQETSLRDDLMAAAEEVEGEEVAVEVEETAAPETAQETEAEVSAEVTSDDGVAEPAGEPAAPAEPVSDLNPPVDWAPEVAAKWGELTPDVQAAIVERERHVNNVLQESAGARQAVESFSTMFQPYIPLMQAEGVSDPLVAVEGLLKTTAALQMGSPHQKAQRIAGLIEHYGVDIGMLDAILAGQPVQDPQASQLNQLLDQRLAPVQELMRKVSQYEQQSQLQMEQENAQTIEQFAADPANKYFNHVRNEMADFLDVAASRGQQMTLGEAYQRACMANPQVSQHYLKDQADLAAQGNSRAVAAARVAGSSVHGTPAGGPGGPITDDMSLREILEAQMTGGGRI
jgi:hypothetical protein